MTKYTALLGLFAVVGCDDSTEPPDPIDPIERAFAAIGGEAAVADLASYRFAVTGTRYFPGEEYRPEDAAPVSHRYTGTRSYDVGADAGRFDITRTLVLFGIDVPQSFTEIVRGRLGHIDGEDGLFGGSAGDLFSAGTAAIRKERVLMEPELVLRDIARDRSIARVAGTAVVDGVTYDLVEVTGEIASITLYVDPAGVIAQATTLENDHLYRDTELVARYADWQPTAGPAIPREVTLAAGDDLMLDETRTTAETNVAIDPATLAFPAGAQPVLDEANEAVGLVDSHFHQSFAGFGFRIDAVQAFVDAAELAPGVWRLGGGTHNSIAVEQSDGIVLIEAPLYGARTEALLAWAAAQFPGKPIKQLVVTHFHDDHSGGVREIAANGTPIVTGAGTEGLLEAAFAAPSTLVPDALATNPVTPTIVRVAAGQTLRLDDAVHPVDVIQVANPHAVDMVIARLPNDAIVFDSDLYSPGFPPLLPQALNEALYAALNDRGFTGDTIVGGHGGIASFAELAVAAGH
jgi:glyoxylase-like metal-dependent hydrolase (beta-lactamase superfamily II)